MTRSCLNITLFQSSPMNKTKIVSIAYPILSKFTLGELASPSYSFGFAKAFSFLSYLTLCPKYPKFTVAAEKNHIRFATAAAAKASEPGAKW